MNDDQKRAAVAKAYSGEKWQQKVKKMSSTQITAVYLRLKAQGKA